LYNVRLLHVNKRHTLYIHNETFIVLYMNLYSHWRCNREYNTICKRQIQIQCRNVRRKNTLKSETHTEKLSNRKRLCSKYPW